MILHILMFKNLKISAFTTPQFIDIDPDDAATQLSRSIQLCEDPDKLIPYRNLDLYHVGDFDDQTGAIVTIDPVFLLSCRDLIAQIEIKKEEKIDD